MRRHALKAPNNFLALSKLDSVDLESWLQSLGGKMPDVCYSYMPKIRASGTGKVIYGKPLTLGAFQPLPKRN